MLRLTFVFVALALDAQDGDQQRDDDDRSGGQCHQEPRLVVEWFLVRVTILEVQLTRRHKLKMKSSTRSVNSANQSNK